MGIAHIGDPLASSLLRGIGAGKGHDLLALLHELVDHRCDALHIGHIHTDDVKASARRLVQPPDLVLGRGFIRGKVFVLDHDAHVLILRRRILDPQRHRIPPGMDSLIGEIKIVAFL